MWTPVQWLAGPVARCPARVWTAIAFALLIASTSGCATLRSSPLGLYGVSLRDRAPAALEPGRWYSLEAWTDSAGIAHRQRGRVRSTADGALEFVLAPDRRAGMEDELHRLMPRGSVRTVRTSEFSPGRTAVYWLGGTALVVVGVVFAALAIYAASGSDFR